MGIHGITAYTRANPFVWPRHRYSPKEAANRDASVLLVDRAVLRFYLVRKLAKDTPSAIQSMRFGATVTAEYLSKYLAAFCRLWLSRCCELVFVADGPFNPCVEERYANRRRLLELDALRAAPELDKDLAYFPFAFGAHVAHALQLAFAECAELGKCRLVDWPGEADAGIVSLAVQYTRQKRFRHIWIATEDNDISLRCYSNLFELRRLPKDLHRSPCQHYENMCTNDAVCLLNGLPRSACPYHARCVMFGERSCSKGYECTKQHCNPFEYVHYYKGPSAKARFDHVPEIYFIEEPEFESNFFRNVKEHFLATHGNEHYIPELAFLLGMNNETREEREAARRILSKIDRKFEDDVTCAREAPNRMEQSAGIVQATLAVWNGERAKCLYVLDHLAERFSKFLRYWQLEDESQWVNLYYYKYAFHIPPPLKPFYEWGSFPTSKKNEMTIHDSLFEIRKAFYCLTGCSEVTEYTLHGPVIVKTVDTASPRDFYLFSKLGESKINILRMLFRTPHWPARPGGISPFAQRQLPLIMAAHFLAVRADHMKGRDPLLLARLRAAIAVPVGRAVYQAEPPDPARYNEVLVKVPSELQVILKHINMWCGALSFKFPGEPSFNVGEWLGNSSINATPDPHVLEMLPWQDAESRCRQT